MRSTLQTRARGYSSVAGILVAASLALSACGASGPSAGSSSPNGGSSASTVSLHARVLNTAKIERAIANSALTQRGKHVRVACPSRVIQRKGFVFHCTAYYGHSTTPFAVTELDGLGNVHYAAG
jgi:hypothetical protein